MNLIKTMGIHLGELTI